jgi:hypothetical protein
MTTYTVGDVLTLTSGQTWRVDHVSPREDGRVTVGLDDPANPGKHGTAFYADVLDNQVIEHITNDRAAVIGNLTADIMASGYNAVGPAETLARRLVNLGWRR